MNHLYLCPECNGYGEVIFITEIEGGKPLAVCNCSLCEGFGFLDWLQNVLRTEKPVESSSIRWLKDEEKDRWVEVSPGKWENIENGIKREGVVFSSQGDGTYHSKRR